MTGGPAPWLDTFALGYLDEVRSCLAQSVVPQLPALVGPLTHTIAAPRTTIRTLGNGGSSAIARILTLALRDTARDHLRDTRISGAWDQYELMAAASRAEFEGSGAQLLEHDHLGPSDLVVLVSGSGNSRNLVAAARHCLTRGVPLVTVTGRTGGTLAAMGVPGIRVDSDDQQIVEDCALAGSILTADAVAAGLAGSPTGRAVDTTVVETGLRPDTGWIDALSTELAQSAAKRRKVIVLAPGGGALGLSAEHVAHNLHWDLLHHLPDTHLDVRNGASLADWTGTVNDSRALGEAEARMVLASDPGDVLVVFADDAGHPAVERIRAAAHQRELTVYGSYGKPPPPHPREHIAVTGTNGLPAALAAQVTGHILLRATRAKITRHPDDDGEDQAVHARLPVAPLAERVGLRPPGE